MQLLAHTVPFRPTILALPESSRKGESYLACPSIEEYLLLDSRSMRIEIYRKEQKKWTYDAFEANDEVELASLGLHFPVADAYEDVLFEPEENDDHLA